MSTGATGEDGGSLDNSNLNDFDQPDGLRQDAWPEPPSFSCVLCVSVSVGGFGWVTLREHAIHTVHAHFTHPYMHTRVGLVPLPSFAASTAHGVLSHSPSSHFLPRAVLLPTTTDHNFPPSLHPHHLPNKNNNDDNNNNSSTARRPPGTFGAQINSNSIDNDRGTGSTGLSSSSGISSLCSSVSEIGGFGGTMGQDIKCSSSSNSELNSEDLLCKICLDRRL
jgi:hypothetical protein